MTKFTTITAAETTALIARKMLNARWVSMALVIEQVAALIQDDPYDADGRGEVTAAFNEVYDSITDKNELYAALRALDIDACSQAKTLLDIAWARQVINKCAERGLVVTVEQVLATNTVKNRAHSWLSASTVQELLSMTFIDHVVVEAYKEATGETITEQQAATALIDCHLINTDKVTCAHAVEYLKANKPACDVMPATVPDEVLPAADIRAMGGRDLAPWLDAERVLPWGRKVFTRAYMARKISDNLISKPDDLTRMEIINFVEEHIDEASRFKVITTAEFCEFYRIIREDGIDPLVVLTHVRDALLNGSPVIPGTL